jgi:glucan phosphoethanolaminetransferase (alkaline phosphatase superfamily)
MKKIQRFFFWVLWVGFWAWVCCRFYYANLDTIPGFPRAFWLVINRIFEVHDADRQQVVEVFTVYGVLFIAVSIIHAIAFFAWRKIKRQKSIM